MSNGETPPKAATSEAIPRARTASSGSAHSTPTRLKSRCERAARLPSVFVMVAAILAVSVVPTLSPRISAMAHLNGITPVLHRMMASAVVALEDCSTAVIAAPASTNSSGDQWPCPRSSVM